MTDDVKSPRGLFEWLVDKAGCSTYLKSLPWSEWDHANFTKAIALRDSAKQEQPGAKCQHDTDGDDNCGSPACAVCHPENQPVKEPQAAIIPGKTAAMLEDITQACPTCPVGGEKCAAREQTIAEERKCSTCCYSAAERCERNNYIGPEFPACWQRKDAP